MMRRRSLSEITFRLRQEVRNVAMLLRPPQLPPGAAPVAPFPDPEPALQLLRSHSASQAMIEIADSILRHDFPLLGFRIRTGPEIRWRRDYVHDKETGAAYFRRIPYLDLSRAGDHKIIWELNRHQHLILLAQVFRLTGDRKYLDEIASQLESWFESNPVHRGINWASALEVAFRALSWMWVDHLVGASLPEVLRRRLWTGLYQHGAHLEANLSLYFSPNTHLLCESVALHALGIMFRTTPEGPRWEQTGARIVNQQMERQVRADGSHFEKSSYYHLYALDLFLFHAILKPPAENYRRSLERMASYLDALMDSNRSIPLIGDDDGGRLFHPFGPRERFSSATLAACGCLLDRSEWIGSPEELHDLAVWWMGERACRAPAGGPAIPRSSSLFPDSGIVSMHSGPVHCIVDAGAFSDSLGHNHADTLSIVARAHGRDLLVDPGTFAYLGEWRDRFRGTAAHNTVRIAGRDQADPAGPFGWRNPPQVEVRQWHSDAASDFLDASCAYRGFRHRRRIFFLKPELMFILDEVSGPQIQAERFWHAGGILKQAGPACFQIADAATLILAGGDSDLSSEGEFGWRSRAYGAKQPAPVIVCRQSGPESVSFGAVLAFSTSPGTAALNLTCEGSNVDLILSGAWTGVLHLPEFGVPAYRPI